jgi:hypothetical protein
MRVYTAKYDAAYNTADNSLVANLLKYPEIAKKVIELYPRYTTTYLLEKLSFGAGEKVLGDNSFEWKSMGRYRNQQTLAAAMNDDVSAVGDNITCSVTDTADAPCMINVNDIIRLSSGLQLHVQSITDGTDVKSVVGKALNDIDADNASGSIVGIVGNAFGEGSLGAEVGEGYAYPETRKNYLTISRKKLVIDARDLTDVTWVEHNGHRLWFFTKEQQTEAQFMYDLEVMRWFGKSSMSGNISTPGGAQSGISGVPTIGDGLLAQIAESNILTYEENEDMTERVFANFLAQLSLNADNPTGNEYVVFTGTQGKLQFHRAMKDLLFKDGGSASSVLVDKAGQDVAVGANFSTYYCMGNKLTLAHCPVFDDPNLASAPGYTSTSASEAEIASATPTTGTDAFRGANLSGLMVFLDMGVQQGVANIELIAKGAEGTNRNWVKKYVPGMINPYDSKSMLAASGDDRFECHWLTQSGIIVRNPLSCGILKPTGLVL